MYSNEMMMMLFLKFFMDFLWILMKMMKKVEGKYEESKKKKNVI